MKAQGRHRSVGRGLGRVAGHLMPHHLREVAKIHQRPALGAPHEMVVAGHDAHHRLRLARLLLLHGKITGEGCCRLPLTLSLAELVAHFDRLVAQD